LAEPSQTSSRIIRCGDLYAQVAEPAAWPRVAPSLAPEVPVLLGQCRGERLRPGLSVHCTDVCDLHDLTIEAMQGESLHFALVLDGQVDVSFGSSHMGFGVKRAGRGSQAQAAFISLCEPAMFVRRARRGNRERKVSISISREWLTEICDEEAIAEGSLHELLDRHLAIERWTPSQRAVALAEQLIHPPPQPLLFRKMYLESRVIELAAEALHALLAAPQPPVVLRQRERERVDAVRELLESGAADGMALNDIARYAGINASTLQKQFRAVFGMAVFDYLRRARLLRARQALERDGRSIVEAADIAGYASPANFATAYRRTFGITPRQSRAVF